MTVFDHPPHSPDLAPVDYFLFPKVKSCLKGRLFVSISDIQKAVTSTLNTIAKDDFYKSTQKLYDRANQCVQLEGMYVEKLNIKNVISFTQIHFMMPVLKLSRRTVHTLPTELKFYWPPLIDVPYELLRTVISGVEDGGYTVALCSLVQIA